jgi:elongator complex protein 3
MLEFGTTRVELGVQILDDNIYQLIRRGHTVNDVIRATKLLKEAGMKVYYHWMPGLPGSNPEHDLELSKQLFNDQRFRPDGLKLYPTLVVASTELEKWYRDNRYQPYTVDDMMNLLINIKSLIPDYVRVSRVMRDIPTQFIIAGCKDLALRSNLKQRMKELNRECHCIRCREYGHRLRDGWKIGDPALKRIDYEASDGKEIFLSFEDDHKTIFGLLRLRIGAPAENNERRAIVRELHVFGSEVRLGTQLDSAAQHKGLGKQLLKEAERISQSEFQAKSISIISGVGARDYFRSDFGYELEGAYMVKSLAS